MARHTAGAAPVTEMIVVVLSDHYGLYLTLFSSILY